LLHSVELFSTYHTQFVVLLPIQSELDVCPRKSRIVSDKLIELLLVLYKVDSNY